MNSKLRIALISLVTGAFVLLGVAPPAWAATISGTITVDGVPTGGIELTTDGGTYSAVSDGTGHYELSGLPTGFFTLSVSDPTDIFKSPEMDLITIDAAHPAIVYDVALELNGPTDGALSGLVTLDGLPAPAGIVVTVGLMDAGPGFTGLTEADGTYEITGLYHDDFTLSVDDPSDLYQDFFRTIVIPDADPTVTENIALESWPVGTAVVAGVVTDRIDDSPLDGVTVEISGTDVQPQAINTLADGGFSFSGVVQADVTVRASKPGYRSEFVSIPVLDGELVPVNFSMVTADATIQGVVRDESANPVEGVTVFAEPTDGGQGASSTTDSGGNYIMVNLGWGEYELRLGGPGSAWLEQTRTTTVAAGSFVGEDFIVQPRPVGALSGIVHGPGGITLPKICVDAYNAAGVIVGANAMSGTAADGLWTIDDLEPGAYRLLYWDCDYTREPAYAQTFAGGGALLSGATTVTVTAGSTVSGIDITLGLGGTIAGVLRVQTPDAIIDFPSGRGMDATVYRYSGSAWEAIPDPGALVSGSALYSYEVRGLLPGTYRVGFVDRNVSGPRGYETEYYQDQPTVATAQDIAISDSSTTVLTASAVAIERPDGTPFSVATAALDLGDEDLIELETDLAEQGQIIEVQVDPNLAGEWISVWGHSTPVLLGGDWVQVPSTGLVRVTVPSALAPGEHIVVAQDAEGAVIGWTAGLQVTAAALAATGAATGWLIPAGVLVVMLGVVLLVSIRVASRRSSTSDAD